MLDKLTVLAIDAGAAILDIYARSDVGASIKGDGSPVTTADEAAEAVILMGLADIAPGVPVVAEEACAAGHVPETPERFFLVDPLDGTKEFLSRNGEFTVNIALIEAGRPVLGVVYVPVQGVAYAGADGEGARRAEVVDGRLGEWRPIVANNLPGDGLKVVASRSHRGPETETYLARFPVADLVSAGSSLKFCRVAEGVADLYPRLGPTMEWDTAAGDAVLRAAGGQVLTLDGAPLAYGKRGRPDAKDFLNPDFVACGAFDPEQAARREALA